MLSCKTEVNNCWVYDPVNFSVSGKTELNSTSTEVPSKVPNPRRNPLLKAGSTEQARTTRSGPWEARDKEKKLETGRYINTGYGSISNETHLLEFLLEVPDDLDLTIGQNCREGAKGGELEGLASKI